MGKKTRRLLIAIIAAVIVGFLGSLGIPLEQGIVEESIDENLPAFSVAEESISLTRRGSVTDVVDGDTFSVLIEGKQESVRVIGIDSPETKYAPGGEECYGEASAVAARTLLEDKAVILTTDPSQDLYDTYGRLLAFVEVDGFDFGERMISGGFAREFTFRGIAHNKQELYRESEAEAKVAGRGLWAACQ